MDRNDAQKVNQRLGELSPSAKRAWIEILTQDQKNQLYKSPSAKRAWIEIANLRK